MPKMRFEAQRSEAFIKTLIDLGVVPENCISAIIEAPGPGELVFVHYSTILNATKLKVVQATVPRLVAEAHTEEETG